MRALRPARRARRPRPTTSGSCARSTASPTASPRRGRARPRAAGPSERAWEVARRRRNGGSAPPRAPRPPSRRRSRPAIWALNRLLRADFDARHLRRGDLPQRRRRRRPRWRAGCGIDAAHVITGHTHRAGPLRGRSRVAAPRRRPPPQHRQLGLRLRLPPPRHAAQPLLAGHRHLARGRGAAAPRAAAARALPREDD